MSKRGVWRGESVREPDFKRRINLKMVSQLYQSVCTNLCTTPAYAMPAKPLHETLYSTPNSGNPTNAGYHISWSCSSSCRFRAHPSTVLPTAEAHPRSPPTASREGSRGNLGVAYSWPNQHSLSRPCTPASSQCFTHIFWYRASSTTLWLTTAAPAKGAEKAMQQYPIIAAMPRAEARGDPAR